MATNPMLLAQKDRRKTDRRRIPINVFATPKLDLTAMFGHAFRGVPLDGSVRMATLTSYAYPLYDANTEFEDFQVALHVAQSCWKYALMGPGEKVLFLEELRATARGTPVQVEIFFALLEGMELRHREMFPQLYGVHRPGAAGLNL